MKYDVFICHASDDKKDFVDSLARSLKLRRLSVWYDEFSLGLGDSLRTAIDHGLRQCNFGIVVLSPAFLRKRWPKRELDGLISREDTDRNVILPIWHNVTAEEVRSFSPMLAGRVAVQSSEGLKVVVDRIMDVASPGLAQSKASVFSPLSQVCSLMREYLESALRTSKHSSYDITDSAERILSALELLSNAIRSVDEATSPDEVLKIADNAQRLFAETLQRASYCLVCKEMNSEMKSARKLRMNNGRLMWKGECQHCGTLVIRLGGTDTYSKEWNYDSNR